MPCPHPRQLADFQAGRTSPEVSGTLSLHLDTCAACRALVERDGLGLAPTLADRPLALDGNIPAPPAPQGPAVELAGELRAGQQVGRYLVLWELGRGGMGAVYAAYDPQLDRKVALKLLHADSVRHPALRERAHARLLREAQAVARVAHPNTIAVHDAGLHEGHVFLALEHLDGTSLRSWVKDEARPWPEVVRVLRLAGEGLAAVHRAGLVHRDFKPGNVMVTTDGRVKVFDFGLARLAATPTSPGDPDAPDDASAGTARPASTAPGPLGEELTAAGFLSGTPGYMAPELLAGGPPTPLSDQFAFGVTLYQCLFGQRPFGDAAHVGDIETIEQGPPFKVTHGGPPPPPWLHAILRRCLAALPAQRYPDMAQVLAALDADPHARRRTLAARGAVVAAAGLAVSLAFMLGQGPRCPTERELAQGLLPTATRAALTTRLSGPSTQALVSELEAQITAWAHERAQACVDARRQPAPPDALPRIECLERRGVALGTLVEVLGTAEPEVLTRAEGVVDQQVMDLSCRQATASHASDEVAPPLRPLALELRRALLKGRALGLTGRLVEAVGVEREVTARAVDAGLAGFEGEALVQGAVHEMYQGHDDVALPHLLAGYGRLLAAGVDEQALLSGRWIIGLLVQRPDSLASAKLVLGDMEALFERLGRPRHLEVDVLGARQSVAWAERRHADAVELARRRVGLAVEVFGPHALQVVQARGALAIAYWELGEVRLSNEQDALALASLERRGGTPNPMLFTRMVSLALGLRHEGRRAEAQALLERARAAALVADPSNATTVGIDSEMAMVLLGTDSPRALTLATRAVTVLETVSSPHELLKALVTRARVLTDLGRVEEALRDTARARTLLGAISDPTGKRRRAVLGAEGHALARQGDAAGAQLRYEEALALPSSVIPDERATLRLGLARVLKAQAREPARVAALAREARDDFARFPGFEGERDAAQALLPPPAAN